MARDPAFASTSCFRYDSSIVKFSSSVPNTASLPCWIPLYTVLKEGLVPSVLLKDFTNAGPVGKLANSVAIRGAKSCAIAGAFLDGSGWSSTLHIWVKSLCGEIVHTSDRFPLFARTRNGQRTLGGLTLCWWQTNITCSLLQFCTTIL